MLDVIKATGVILQCVVHYLSFLKVTKTTSTLDVKHQDHYYASFFSKLQQVKYGCVADFFFRFISIVMYYEGIVDMITMVEMQRMFISIMV